MTTFPIHDLMFHSKYSLCDWLRCRDVLWTSTCLVRIMLVIVLHPIREFLSTWLWSLEWFILELLWFLSFNWEGFRVGRHALVHHRVAFSKLRSTSFSLLLLILRKNIWEHDFITAIAFIHVPLALGIPVQIHKLSGVLIWSLRSVAIGILVV